MALKRNVSRAIGRTVNKWPEFETVAAGTTFGGLVCQVVVAANYRRYESSVRVGDDGEVSEGEMATMLREIAWMMDGKGEPPAWELKNRQKAALKAERILMQADRIRSAERVREGARR